MQTEKKENLKERFKRNGADVESCEGGKRFLVKLGVRCSWQLDVGLDAASCLLAEEVGPALQMWE